jgi:hypothetical protein
LKESRYLAVIETQRVKGYLFASPILRETRGASLLLDRLNRRETQAILDRAGGRSVYLGGGSGRALFGSREEAEDFANKILVLYRDQARSARVSVEVLERDGEESFPAWVARGVAESRKNKLSRAEALPSLGGRWLRPCTSCGKEPAEQIPPPDIQGNHLLCRSCFAKRQEIRQFYGGVKGNLDRLLPMPTSAELKKRGWPDFILTTLAEKVEGEGSGSARETIRTLLPRDFDHIGERSRPRNYIGLIYADGNRMGETIRAMATKFPGDEEAQRAYGAFSRIVDQATREAAVEAVLERVETPEMDTEDGKPARLVPAEFLIAGGDDLILIVPAHAALGVTERFLTRFQEKSQVLQDEAAQKGEIPHAFAEEGLTTSAGVVISHASYPASQLVDLAAELMKSAKRKAADLARDRRFEGTMDFMVVHESGTESMKQRKEEYEGKTPTGCTVRRTERPYTAGEMARLRERILALKEAGVPRGKLKALYSSLFRSPVEAQYEAARIRERLIATGQANGSGPLAQLFTELSLFPFRERSKEEWSTPLTELIEIYDFTHADEESAPAADREEILA